VNPGAFTPDGTARLRALACRGTFEAHLTVEADGDERRAAFEALCRRLDVKCVLIELARGVHRSQPMTSSHHRGDLATVIDQIEALHRGVCDGGFPVIRVKLEAVATNDGVPISDDEAAALPGAYFEFHGKLRLPAGTGERELDAIRAVCVAHGAHLSRNDRARDEAGVATRFVTLRVYGRGRDRATVAYDALVDALTRAGHAVAGSKAEYTVYDGRVELDAGWLAEVPP
jgi:hypothetical protein